MQKNLLTKTLIIAAVLLLCLYGMLGWPTSFSGQGLKAAIMDRIHLGLDLKGGTHLVLQVQVNDAINAETDHAIETLKDEMAKDGITYADIAKPDANSQPEKIVIKGVPLDAGSKIRSAVTDRFREYDIASGAEGTWTMTMKPTVISDLKTRTVDLSIEAIRRRVDSLGVSEPSIQRNGMGNNQILVQLPGVDDPGRVKEIIQSTARLEIHQCFGTANGYANEQEALLANKGMLPPGTILLHGSPGGAGDQGDHVFVIARVPIVGGTDIMDASPGTDQNGRPSVNFQLTAAAGRKFSAFTSTHNEGSGDPNPFIAIVLDSKVREAASVKTEIRDRGEIAGGFTEQTARDLAMLLKSGALPASLHYLTERTIGPSLGADSIKAGVNAAIFGMLAVLVFMLIYYRGAGINANVALILNLIILLGFMGFTGQVLTLPGIAGVILTVGMGVDSNVLIFERIREELRNNKAPAAAVDQGFDRAWTTILDTHVTTIVSAVILFFVGSGPVRGFAVTLTFGLLANLFTAVFVSRVIFDAVLNRKQRGEALSI
ncbi:MAG: protein translocase subunit SecD [Acidobacteriia bacterium]|nr:protein translocase subunit SecD [Terriglobia bacterium]